MNYAVKSAIAVMMPFSAIAQPIAVIEYDYHKNQNDKSYSHYVAAGMILPTAIGSIDLYLQDVNSAGKNWKDSLNGWETGYSYKIEGDGYAIIPRIAVGQMSNINFQSFSNTSVYSLVSVELSKQITDSIGGFASISHMNGMNQWAIPASNRTIIGLDVGLPQSNYLRIGYSVIRQFKTTQDGIIVALSRGF